MPSGKDLSTYIRQFKKLRRGQSSVWTADTQYQAPHKPFLLLAILDLFAQGRILTNLIEINAELGELFAGYWSIVIPNRRGNMALPFFHLRTSPFWHLVPQSGQEEILKTTRQVDTLTQLNQLILGATLDNELFQLLRVGSNRSALRSVLVQAYFSPECQPVLIAQSETNWQSFLYSQELIKHGKSELKDAVTEDEAYKSEVRDQGFRRAVVKLYEHRCALCGVRMMTVDGRTVVDAAHIIPWSVSHNDDVHNGMALCRLCHWTFDEGLLGISSDYLVLLSPDLRITQNMPGHLLTLEDRIILGPKEEDFWPDRDSLSWHRKNIFRGN